MNIQEVFTGSFAMYRVFIEGQRDLFRVDTIESENNMTDDIHDFYSKLLSLRYNVPYDKIWIIPERREPERFKR